jgi:putative ABC transport system permease protein
VLVVSEMALSATLLVGATLLVRTVVALQHADLGFEPKNLYMVSVPFLLGGGQASKSAFREEPARVATMRQILERVHAIPSVRSVALTRVEPGSRWFSIGRFEIEGEPAPPTNSTSFTDISSVGQNYFATMGIRFESGGIFTDTTQTSRQVIVNSGFARKHWAKGAAIGRRIRIADSDTTPWLTIVGVVNDAQTTGPGVEATVPILYSPMWSVGGAPTLMLRIDGPPSTLAPVTTMLKELGLKRVQPPRSVAEFISRSIAAQRFVMTLLTVLTALALILAAVGLYGMMAYTVAQ